VEREGKRWKRGAGKEWKVVRGYRMRGAGGQEEGRK
jgi:hypothetical protein